MKDACYNRDMRFTLLLALVSTALAQSPAVPVANGHTPSTLVNSLAVKRDWTLQDSSFCQSRAAENASIALPTKVNSKFKFIRTFAFRAKTNVSNERAMLDYTNAGFQVPFPWQEGQWMARQYTSEFTRGYTYLLEMQDRPKEPGAFGQVASVCVTVLGLR